MDVIQAIHQRHSYRGMYTDQPVPREHLVHIMQAGLAAPSGCNLQTTSFIAVENARTLENLHRVIQPPIGQSAPAMICVLTKRTIAYADRCFCVQDYAAAIQNMLLAIVTLGYASCWVEGHITDADNIAGQMAEILQVPPEYELVCVLPVGVPAQEPAKAGRLPFAQRAWFNRFGQDEWRC